MQAAAAIIEVPVFPSLPAPPLYAAAYLVDFDQFTNTDIVKEKREDSMASCTYNTVGMDGDTVSYYMP